MNLADQLLLQIFSHIKYDVVCPQCLNHTKGATAMMTHYCKKCGCYNLNVIEPCDFFDTVPNSTANF